MAIVDKYRNKLMSSKKNSLQDGLQSGTQNGLQDSLQDNTTNVENTEQNTEQNTSNNYWLNLASKLNGAINKGVGYVTNSIQNNINDAVNSVKNKNTSNNLKYQDYASLIDMKTANPKAELQTAMQRAQSASNAYLKALGLQGSGVGQSQLTDIGVQYQNALSKINQTAQDEVNAQLDTDFKSMADNGASSNELENYIKAFGEQTGKAQEWQNYADSVEANFDSEVQRNFDNIRSMIEDESYTTLNGTSIVLTKEQKDLASDILNQLTEAYENGDKASYNKILDKYSTFLNDPRKISSSEMLDSESSNIKAENLSSLKANIDTANDAYDLNNGYKIMKQGNGQYAVFKNPWTIAFKKDLSFEDALKEAHVTN